MSVRVKFTALLAGVIVLGAALVIVVEAGRAVLYAKSSAMRIQQESVRVLATAFDYALPGTQVRFGASGDVERLSWDAPPGFDDHTMIDRVGSATGETATIFVRTPEDGEFVRRSTNIVKPDGARAVGTVLGKDGAVHPVVAAGGVFSGEATILGREYFTIYMPIYDAAGEVDGVLYVGAAKPDAVAVFFGKAVEMVPSALAALALCLAIAWPVSGRAMAMLDGVRATLARMTSGDVETPAADVERDDEIGALARDLESLRSALALADDRRAEAETAREALLDRLADRIGGVVDAAARGDYAARVCEAFDEPQLMRLATGVNAIVEGSSAFLDDLGATLQAMADGDLRRKVQGRYMGRLGEVAAAADSGIDHLAALVSQVHAAAEVGAGAVDKINDGARDLSSRAESQAASLEETAATMEEMAASVRSNAAALQEADRLAADVTARTQSGSGTVADAIASVNRIKQSSDKISGIIEMIESIAWQTNLLALNASVEAARAGEAGRGFAVVASEVRALAQRATDAAAEISGLVQTSASNVTEGIGMVEKTGAALDGISRAIVQLAERLASVSAAGSEQATGVDEINGSISQMDRITQENAALTDRFVSEASTLGERMAGLRKSVASFAFDQRSNRAA
ncbi:methyl-accepting chemotaxis protein [Rubrimonas cliftonensis]|uniref:Methyl-accepting chemotaxis protein n=1 Tax=Rubrimonas cliftonensis TaxID=89524 RepID=A0A1H4DWI8_9RHOB|nr:methyl-accepting chemotaxis protein [Rubrimonas cliftonensis]SEA76967.1 methyl-accepting chemotaxis protein [Rubrimonas cliftonensis]